MAASTSTALILVDLQEDYLAAPELAPSRDEVVTRAADLLQVFRSRAAPIVHVRTRVAADGNNAMPHRREHPRCVDGTPGQLAPSPLRELAGEPVFEKQAYSGFGDGTLETWLRSNGIDSVVIAGAYTHACVRQAAIDASERGFAVTVAVDACASDAPVHAAETLAWMGQRFVTLGSVADTATGLDDATAFAAHGEVADACGRAAIAQVRWAAVPLEQRREVVAAWRGAIEARREAFAEAIVADVRKPLRMARDEVQRAIAHIEAALAVFTKEALAPEVIAPAVSVSREPLGVVGVVMPWNNPVALPVANIAPALLAGNTVVLKPAPEAARSTALIMASLTAAGFPPDVVTVIPATVEAGQQLAHQPAVTAIALTGSNATGRAIARVAAARLLPLRAELGGNNAVIVLPDADLPTVARELVANAFAFAGQRCTALRRAVVHADVLDEFRALVVAEAKLLAPADPLLEATVCGPLVSDAALDRVLRLVADASSRGARVLCGGERVSLGDTSAMTPAVLELTDPSDPIVQQESFGPVLVIQPAATVEAAIDLANGVEQGLLLAICTNDAVARDRVHRAAQVGIIQHSAAPLPVHDMAAFGGWKDSGLGGAEHGRWDLDFFTRPQTSYR